SDKPAKCIIGLSLPGLNGLTSYDVLEACHSSTRLLGVRINSTAGRGRRSACGSTRTRGRPRCSTRRGSGGGTTAHHQPADNQRRAVSAVLLWVPTRIQSGILRRLSVRLPVRLLPVRLR